MQKSKPTTSHSTKNKYNAKKTIVDGIKFDSKKEAERYKELRMLEDHYIINGLKTQVSFPLIKKSKYGREIVYKADFVYYENGKMVVEDTKGYRTPIYKLKRRILAEWYGIEIVEK